MSELLSDISAALQASKAKLVKELVTQALADGVSAKDILEYRSMVCCLCRRR
jgi:hypothetical protein